MASLASIPARTQYSAIAWMRWRLFVNSFRRSYTDKRRIVGLILTILLRILVWSVMAALVIGPIIAYGIASRTLVIRHRPADLPILLGTVFLIWQFFAINGMSVAANVANFDPASLIRFPLPFRRYLIIRLLLGWLTPSTIFGCLCMLSVAIGLGLANRRLILPAMLVLAVYAGLNVLFVRMLGIWIERWLSTRRGREVYGLLFALTIIGLQYFNMRVNSDTSGRTPAFFVLMQHAASFIYLLPPGLAANSILPANPHPLTALFSLAGLIAYTALFFAIFAARSKKQFLGEYLSDGSGMGASTTARPRPAAFPRVSKAASGAPGQYFFSAAFSACLYKEWIYSHRNARFITLLTPIFLVFVLGSGRGMFGLHPDFLLPGALAYVLFTPMAQFYNIFGEDAFGVQFYLIAPIRLRDVVLAKNTVTAGRTLILAILAWIVVLFVAHAPIPAMVYLSTALWMVFALFFNLAIGTLRSILAPRRFAPGQAGKAGSGNPNQASGWLSVVLSLGSGFVQIPILLLGRRLELPWFSAAVFAILSIAAIAGYGIVLGRSERLTLNHRDGFSEELCKAD